MVFHLRPTGAPLEPTLTLFSAFDVFLSLVFGHLFFISSCLFSWNFAWISVSTVSLVFLFLFRHSRLRTSHLPPLSVLNYLHNSFRSFKVTTALMAPCFIKWKSLPAIPFNCRLLFSFFLLQYLVMCRDLDGSVGFGQDSQLGLTCSDFNRREFTIRWNGFQSSTWNAAQKCIVRWFGCREWRTISLPREFFLNFMFFVSFIKPKKDKTWQYLERVEDLSEKLKSKTTNHPGSPKRTWRTCKTCLEIKTH